MTTVTTIHTGRATGLLAFLARRPLTVFVVKRVLQAVLVLFLVATVAFFIIRITGDPVRALLPEGASLRQERDLRHALGYDRPLLVQYVNYLNDLLHGNFGQSVFFQQPAISMIMARLPATVELAGAALAFAVIVAIPAGIVSAVRRGRATDSVVMAAVLIGQSTPAFFVGIVLILVFAVQLRVLPASGIGGFGNLVLPAITLGLYSAAIIARLLRSSLIEVLGEDHIRTARAKGLSPGRVIVGNGLRNAALPVVTIVGLEVGTLLGGAILTEQVFSWPGVGRLTIEAITNRDYPLVQATVLFLAVVFVGVNLVVDLLYAFLDPRVRLS